MFRTHIKRYNESLDLYREIDVNEFSNLKQRSRVKFEDSDLDKIDDFSKILSKELTSYEVNHVCSDVSSVIKITKIGERSEKFFKDVYWITSISIDDYYYLTTFKDESVFMMSYYVSDTIEGLISLYKNINTQFQSLNESEIENDYYKDISDIHNFDYIKLSENEVSYITKNILIGFEYRIGKQRQVLSHIRTKYGNLSIIIYKYPDDYFRVSWWVGVDGNLSSRMCDQMDGLKKCVDDILSTLV